MEHERAFTAAGPWPARAHDDSAPTRAYLRALLRKHAVAGVSVADGGVESCCGARCEGVKATP